MYITDLNNNKIDVTNIDAAIEEADNFRKMKHDDPSFQQFDKDRNAYWQDVYIKLLQLKNIAQ